MKLFSIIVAFDSEYGIGKNGQLPWYLPADLKHFKQVTTTVTNPSKKNAVVMGRKTWDSLPEKFRPLAGRVNLVLTKSGSLMFPAQVLNAASLDEALKELSSAEIENIFVIGGAQIYVQAINHPLCHRILVTHIKGIHGCDAFFPPISKSFLLISNLEEQIEDGISFQFSEYLRS